VRALILSFMPMYILASVASSERSFSTFQQLKTWVRNSMGEERLTGSALMNIDRDIDLDVNDIIDRFA